MCSWRRSLRDCKTPLPGWSGSPCGLCGRNTVSHLWTADRFLHIAESQRAWTLCLGWLPKFPISFKETKSLKNTHLAFLLHKKNHNVSVCPDIWAGFFCNSLYWQCGCDHKTLVLNAVETLWSLAWVWDFQDFHTSSVQAAVFRFYFFKF